jgi:DNA mismatch repair protein MutL
MKEINVLDHQTIDKIAAGEVVEKPASVVKELVENAMDAGADAITVEIKEGGISFLRVTDNGEGIEKSQVRNAFLRHATSKIRTADDLTDLVSLGFRGEALASIAAVSMVELITKTPDELLGVRYCIDGGVEKELEEIGAPDGTTIMIRNLFYNTPARKKFLKQAQTEASYISDLMEHLAMSHPEVSFKFVVNGQNRFYTAGNGELLEIIYRIYGKDISDELTPFTHQENGLRITGFLGKPVINRSNRNYEIFYINGRYIRSSLISKAVEEGYREYLMQHKFPFCVLHFQIDTSQIDVNVHPTKMDVRISDAPVFYEKVKSAIHDALHQLEMIPKVVLEPDTAPVIPVPSSVPEPFESRRIASVPVQSEAISRIYEKSRPLYVQEPENIPVVKDSAAEAFLPVSGPESSRSALEPQETAVPEPRPKPPVITKGEQMELFDDRLLSAKAKEQYDILGQLFETYWLIQYQDKLLIIDQHAAHEKVKYERFMKRFYAHNIISQAINPPMIVTLTGREEACYRAHREDFEALGFEIEEFGVSDFAIRGVPLDLYGYREEDFFREILDELVAENVTGTPESIRIRIATMACKAAVKGNMRLTTTEAKELIDELLTLDNPYNCPHGRPTIISMSKYELEKKFKRIVT